jgi:hypothetical protein
MKCIQRGYCSGPRSWLAVGNCLAIFLFAEFGWAQGNATFGTTPIVWAVPSSLHRVGPTDAPGSRITATIYGGRGEYIPFQVAVRAPQGGLTKVSLSISNGLTGPDGATIPSTNLIRYRESYITVPTRQHSVLDDEGCPPAPNLCPTWFYDGDNGTQVVPLTINTFPDALIPRQGSPRRRVPSMRLSSPAWPPARMLSSGLIRLCLLELLRENTQALIP